MATLRAKLHSACPRTYIYLIAQNMAVPILTGETSMALRLEDTVRMGLESPIRENFRRPYRVLMMRNSDRRSRN